MGKKNPERLSSDTQLLSWDRYSEKDLEGCTSCTNKMGVLCGLPQTLANMPPELKGLLARANKNSPGPNSHFCGTACVPGTTPLRCETSKSPPADFVAAKLGDGFCGMECKTTALGTVGVGILPVGTLIGD